MTLHFRPAEQSAVLSQQPRIGSFVGQSAEKATLANPIDKTSSVDVALQVARAAGMQEQIAVMNTSDSDKLSQTVSSANAISISSKPQIVATNFVSNKDIKTYVTKAGDSISSIAEAFGITSDSIRWSNDLRGDSVGVGVSLKIPPVNGIVYIVQSGDSIDRLAQYYSSDKQKLIAYNDAELSGIQAGEQILIPDGKKPTPRTYSYSGYYGFAFGSTAIYGYNGYIPGYCTYYVASRINVPVNWGNANTWDNNARRTPGWVVNGVPVAGSIAQTDRMSSLGHVAYVEEVSEDGTQVKISDMNYGGRWVVRSGVWMPASTFENYIHRG